ncbi:MAG: glycoside hydrolase family 3 C-terminal domain-containing protein [Prevotella sp.]
MSSNLQAQAPQLGKAPLDEVINAMTLKEKLKVIIGPNGQQKINDAATIGNASRLVPGAAGQIGGIDRLGIPVFVMADGPAGLRIYPTRKGTDKTFYCTHFPVGTLLSSSWNQSLVEKVGKAMGDEVKHYGVDVLLAPGINIMRNPLCGRNFEYYSEDPLVAGKTAAAMVRGIQSNGVGTSVKHFALNDQETNRTGYDVIVDPRTAREIYLKPFEIAVKEAQPWTVMSSYNLINGTMASERADLLTQILRNEWGFKGVVMSDWYGGRNAVLQVQAGNDLLMPGKYKQMKEITDAISSGRLNRDDIDRNLRRALELIMRSPRFNGYVADNNPDLKAHAQMARQSATEGMVLLKNDKQTLPLSGNKKVAVFGRTSCDFLAGGTGSGDVHHAYVVSLIEGLQNAGYTIDDNLRQTYEKYIKLEKESAPVDTSKWAQFLPLKLIPELNVDRLDLNSLAADNDLALLTLGKSSGEFADRRIIDGFNLTEAEKNMVSRVCKAFHSKGKKVVAILNVCGPIETDSWIDGPDAVLTAWLPGQEGGNAVADILTGKVSPSGRLPMTWPRSYNDVPSRNDFVCPDDYTDADLMATLSGFTEGENVESGKTKNFDYITYNDSVYVGYRYYTTRNVPVSFPFGYGLSYTTFKYGKPSVTVNAQGDIIVNVQVTNNGTYSGKEVVQVYVSAPGKDMNKPARELKAYAKTRELKPRESENISLTIPYSELASFSNAGSCWQVEPGTYRVLVARNAADAKPLIVSVNEKGGVTETVQPCLLPEKEYK